MSELFSIDEIEPDKRFLLQSITVFNWGPFTGLHKPAEIDPRGTAIIGATGSGKTTLIDALMTLLVARPVYNLASTGGHDKNDRSVTSYVRGVKGMVDDAGGSDNVLRPGKTVTGISAQYSDGEHLFKIGGLLWFDTHSNAASELHKLWFVIENHEDDLTHLLHLFNAGGKSALVKYGKEYDHLTVFGESKKQYLSRIRRFFEVGENAFDLLNRAAGLKQLNSINQIFRELVLDNKPLFDRALKVADGFASLEEIYQELMRSKNQIDSLLPIEKEHKKWEKLQEREQQYRGFREILPVWFAQREVTLWTAELERNEAERTQLTATRREREAEELATTEKARTLQAKYMEQGGAAIEEVEKALRLDRERVEKVLGTQKRYEEQADEFALTSPLTPEHFQENQTQIEEHLQTEEAARETTQDALIDLRAQSQNLITQRTSLQQELDEISARPKSNIPAKYQHFREDLATHLQLKGEDLPYMAEMVEVKAEEREWTGAIERALGAERLRLLIPEEHFSEAKHWVNNRDNKVHVRLLDLSKAQGAGTPHSDSFIHKLTLEKDSKYTPALMDILLRKDRHCVDSAEALGAVNYSMTREGLMYDKDGRFDKQDQRPLSQGWMTGFDNHFLLEQIQAELKELDAALKAPLVQAQQLQNTLRSHEGRVKTLHALAQFQFDDLDLKTYEDRVKRAQDRLAQLEDPNSDLALTKREFQAAEQALRELRKACSQLDTQLGRVSGECAKSQKQLDYARALAGSELTEEEERDFQKELKCPAELTLEIIPTVRPRVEREIIKSLDSLTEKITIAQGNLRAGMEKAQRVDSGALTETGTELVDVPDYLERLDYLRKEDLPERQKRFMHYLNVSSTQGVTQLLEHIKNEVSKIKDRLEQLNDTLRKVEYKKGRFLQLEASELGNDYLRAVDKAEKKHRVAVLEDKDDGERVYNALKALIEIIREAATNNRKLASQALLDPRHRLEFFVREIDRETGNPSGKIMGSQTGSGGEKEQMASYILTASLSYALSPKGASRPKYATIILDEAFSKSSQSAASKIIHALKEFGLHPLFVTPNKEMSLLKSNTASAILVHQATLTSLKWKELDEIYETRKKAGT